jgi:hypothetical protein
MAAMLDAIRESWAWTGLDAADVVRTNEFGNVIVRAADGAIWRICPEELSCKIIAHNDAEYEALWASEEFQLDWRMERLVEIVRVALDPVESGQCYCLKVPAVLGGRYDVANLGTIRRRELIGFAGDVARQIKDVADGGFVKFTRTN